MISVSRAVLRTSNDLLKCSPQDKKPSLTLKTHLTHENWSQVDIQKLEDVRIHEQEEEQSELDSGRDAN